MKRLQPHDFRDIRNARLNDHKRHERSFQGTNVPRSLGFLKKVHLVDWHPYAATFVLSEH